MAQLGSSPKPNGLDAHPCATMLKIELTGSFGGVLVFVEVAPGVPDEVAVPAVTDGSGPESEGISSNSSTASWIR